MRKISKSRSAVDTEFPDEQNNANERPRHIPGATITAWHGSPTCEPEALLARSGDGSTVAGAARSHIVKDTVVLADGTRLSFTSPDQYKSVLNT
jgi:hypothetical protein